MLCEPPLPLPILDPMRAVERTERREKLPTFDRCRSSSGSAAEQALAGGALPTASSLANSELIIFNSLSS